MFVHQGRAVGRHAREQQGLLQAQQVHLREKCFSCDGLHHLHLSAVKLQLLVGGRDADDFGGAARQFQRHARARAAQQHRFQMRSQGLQILVAQNLAGLACHPVAINEAVRRTQPPRVDEFDH